MKKKKCFENNARYWMAAIFFLTVMLSHSLLNAAPQHQLTFTPENYDCGTLDEGMPAVMQVIIKNNGQNKVVIDNVRTN